jgi:hypothetical protein
MMTRQQQNLTLKSASQLSIKWLLLLFGLGTNGVSAPAEKGTFDRTDDGGMLEFCPRNIEGFQNELAFRCEHGLPFVTGSLSAHECCAIAAHNARKIHVVQQFKDRQMEIADAEFGMTCGRTLRLGKDGAGRAYWKFHKDPDSLFVFVPGDSRGGQGDKWHRYAYPETIASIISSLGKDEVVKDIKRSFPAAALMHKEGTWSNALLKRHFPNAIKPRVSLEEDGESSDQEVPPDSQEDGEENDDEGEEVRFLLFLQHRTHAITLLNLVFVSRRSPMKLVKKCLWSPSRENCYGMPRLLISSGHEKTAQ